MEKNNAMRCDTVRCVCSHSSLDALSAAGDAEEEEEEARKTPGVVTSVGARSVTMG